MPDDISRQFDADQGTTFIEDEGGTVLGCVDGPVATVKPAAPADAPPLPWKPIPEGLQLGREIQTGRAARVSFRWDLKAWRAVGYLNGTKQGAPLVDTPHLDVAMGAAVRWFEG